MVSIAVNQIDKQNKPKRPPLCSRLGSFWFSTRFTREILDHSNGIYLYSNTFTLGSMFSRRQTNLPKSPILFNKYNLLTVRWNVFKLMKLNSRKYWRRRLRKEAEITDYNQQRYLSPLGERGEAFPLGVVLILIFY